MGKQNTILIVDDMALARLSLRRLLEDQYAILEADNGEQALDRIRFYGSELCAVLLDVVMPEKDGLQVLAYMKREKLINRIPVILVTAEESERVISLGFDLGASDVIHKPYNPIVIKRRLQNLLELYQYKKDLEQTAASQNARLAEQARRMKEQARRISKVKEIMVDTLSTVIEYRDLESGQHVNRIRSYTRALLETARKTGFPLKKSQIDQITDASALHDIGKIAIPDSILLKPGPLTAGEFEIMKTHTVKAGEILNHLLEIDDKLYLAYCYEICLSHHERWNGEGYPNGLKGDQIPLSAQAVALADVYDALTTKRVYKPAYSIDKAIQMITNGECGSFSPAMLDVFLLAAPRLREISRALPDAGRSCPPKTAKNQKTKGALEEC